MRYPLPILNIGMKIKMRFVCIIYEINKDLKKKKKKITTIRYNSTELY